MNQKYAILILLFSSNLTFASRFPSNEINLKEKERKKKELKNFRKIHTPKIENFRELNEIVAMQGNGADINEVVITKNSVITTLF